MKLTIILAICLQICLQSKADVIEYIDKTLICDYDLTIPLNDGTVLFKVIPLLGKATYKETNRYGHITYGVDFNDDLKKINLKSIYNPAFIDNVDAYKCKELQ